MKAWYAIATGAYDRSVG